MKNALFFLVILTIATPVFADTRADMRKVTEMISSRIKTMLEAEAYAETAG